jgi:hypothetical protein
MLESPDGLSCLRYKYVSLSVVSRKNKVWKIKISSYYIFSFFRVLTIYRFDVVSYLCNFKVLLPWMKVLTLFETSKPKGWMLKKKLSGNGCTVRCLILFAWIPQEIDESWSELPPLFFNHEWHSGSTHTIGFQHAASLKIKIFAALENVPEQDLQIFFCCVERSLKPVTLRFKISYL